MLMRGMPSALLLLVLVALVASVTGCGGSSKAPTPASIVSNELEGAPDWVLKMRDNDKDKIYGLGSCGGTRNVELARTTALARARDGIARTLQVETRSMLEDYMATTTGGVDFGSAASDEQNIEFASVQISKMDLSGTSAEKLWISKSGAVYILASLNAEEFKNTVAKMGQLSEAVRQAIAERADEKINELWERTGE